VTTAVLAPSVTDTVPVPPGNDEPTGSGAAWRVIERVFPDTVAVSTLLLVLAEYG
jgi:hypothetical protein